MLFRCNVDSEKNYNLTWVFSMEMMLVSASVSAVVVMVVVGV